MHIEYCEEMQRAMGQIEVAIGILQSHRILIGNEGATEDFSRAMSALRMIMVKLVVSYDGAWQKACKEVRAYYPETKEEEE